MNLYMTEIHVRDPDRVSRWYVEVLGLRVTHRDDPKGFVLVESPGGGRIALKRMGRRAGDPKGVRLVFRVEDVVTERDRLLGIGVQVDEAAENTEEHYHEIRLMDPEGVPITIFSWGPR